MLTHEFAPRRGGIAVYAEEMARAAAALGHLVEVWAPAPRGQSWPDFPFKMVWLRNRGTLDWRCRSLTRKVVLSRSIEEPDTTLYLVEPGPMMALMESGAIDWLEDHRIVLTLHGSEILRFHRWRHWRRRFAKFLDRAEVVSVVSEPIRQLLGERFGAAAAERALLAPGALRHDFPLASQANAKPRENGKVRFLTVARIHPRKGQLALVEALAALPKTMRKGVELQLAGPVRDARYFRQLFRQADAGGVALDYLGEVADGELPAIYAGADVFAMTSLPLPHSIEGFGLVYLEAAACGLPVLAHDTGGVSAAVAHEVSGLLLRPGDSAALMEACRRLIEEPELRARLAQGGRDRLSHFSWSENVRRLFGSQKAAP
ncbi:MAG: glycosyltransferase family 4 protein [Opitutales bacterium]